MGFRATPGCTAIHETAIGRCRISWSPQGLTEVKLLARGRGGRDREPMDAGQPPPTWVREAVALLVRHLNGAPQDLSAIPLDMEGLPAFHRKVYEVARGIAAGCTASYGELAAMAGSPRAARAVGQALAKNPFLIFVPCHRILASGGTAGGFSAPGGLRTKARLLALEGVSALPRPHPR